MPALHKSEHRLGTGGENEPIVTLGTYDGHRSQVRVGGKGKGSLRVVATTGGRPIDGEEMLVGAIAMPERASGRPACCRRPREDWRTR